MKIAITATGPTLDDEVDPRFGRCRYFIVADTETMEVEALENSNAVSGSGVGISNGQMIADKGAQAVLTGNCGPNAYQVLSAAGLQVITGVTGKVRDAIEGYNTGRFRATAQPNVTGHFGVGAASGMGMGGGMGMGRRMSGGRGTMPPAGPIPQAMNLEEDLDELKSQTEMLRQRLEQLQQRFKDMEDKK